MTDKVQNLITRAITGALFVTIMVVGFFNPRAMVALFAFITGMAVWEYTGLVNQRENIKVNRFISTIAGVYFFIAVAAFRIGIATNFVIFVPYLLTVVYLFISELYLKQKDPVNDWAYTMLGQMYIALPLSMINILGFEVSANGNTISYNMLIPLCVFIFLWLNDTGAYCSGSLFGKHKLFPRISPAKSWEGSIGGFVASMLVAAILSYYFKDLASWQWYICGAIIVVAGTYGDLVESLFKRSIQIKDSASTIPGHGGFLDRFDGLLLSIPFILTFLKLF